MGKSNGKLISWEHPGGKFRREGPTSCTEGELLAIVLGSGSRGRTAEEIGEEIIDKYGTLLDLMGVTLRELMEIKGLGGVGVTKIAAVFEIARRIVKHLERQ